jgi:hypothetical protein
MEQSVPIPFNVRRKHNSAYYCVKQNALWDIAEDSLEIYVM